MSKHRKTTSGGALSSVTSCISTTLVLILLGTVVAFVTIANNFGNAIRENFTVEVLLDDSIPQRDLTVLQGRLAAQPYSRQVNYISKEQGTKEMMTDLGGAPEDFIGSSPIPAEYEVFLKADYATPDSLQKYMPVLRHMPYVKDVVYPLDLMQTVDHSIRNVSVGLLVVAALLAFVSFALINNTVRMNIYAHRYAIQTLKLVGAKWRFIRRPFMRRGLVSGLIAAVVAGVIVMAGMQTLVEMNGNADFAVVTPMVIGVTLGSIFVGGILLTLLCTYISVNRHLRMSQAESRRR